MKNNWKISYHFDVRLQGMLLQSVLVWHSNMSFNKPISLILDFFIATQIVQVAWIIRIILAGQPRQSEQQ